MRTEETETSSGCMSKAKAAAYLDVAPYTVDYLVRVGRLPYTLIAGKRRFLRQDLDALIAAGRVDNRPAKDHESLARN